MPVCAVLRKEKGRSGDDGICGSKMADVRLGRRKVIVTEYSKKMLWGKSTLKNSLMSPTFVRLPVTET